MAKKNASRKAQDKGNKGDGKPSNPVRRTKPHDDDDDNPIRASKKLRDLKGTALASMKPSYCLKRGIGHPNPHRDGESLRSAHRKRLRLLLKKLLRKHNWVEASGVLSVLLQASAGEKSISRIRRKYWAALELLRRIKGDKISKRKMQLVYDLRMKKLGPMKKRPTKERFAAQCEYIIFRLNQGDIEDAGQAALCLMQEHGFESDAVSNLVVGMTYIQLWYAGIPSEMQLQDTCQSSTPMQSFMSGAGIQSEKLIKLSTPVKLQTSVDRISKSIESHDPIRTQGTNFSLKCDSSTSVGNEKDYSKLNIDHSSEAPTAVDGNMHRKTPWLRFEEEDFHRNSAERSEHEEPSSQHHSDDIPSASIFYTHGLPPWLLPLQLPHSTENLENFIYMHRNSLNDYYKDGLKCLRAALNLDPPALEAFHPLVQMLLSGDQVEEALDEVEKFICNPCTAVQLRLKTSLLEYFDNGNNLKLSTHIEEILKRDPTCSSSVEKLVDMHLSGHYSTEKLVEMIGLHLDATFAQCNTWEVFASCLLNLSHCEGDCLSTCSNGDEDGQKNMYSHHINQIPAIFTNPETMHTWRLRCRWWQKRHYSRKIIGLEIAEGEWRLMTHKAAVASHLYGREFGYVVKASQHLKGEEKVDLLSTLRFHIQNCVGFYFNLGCKNI